MSFEAENRFKPFYFSIVIRKVVVSPARHSAGVNKAMFRKQVRSVNPATCNSSSSVLTSFCRAHLQKKEDILVLVPQVILKQNGCPIWIDNLDGIECNELQTPVLLWRPLRVFFVRWLHPSPYPVKLLSDYVSIAFLIVNFSLTSFLSP